MHKSGGTAITRGSRYSMWTVQILFHNACLREGPQ